MVTFHLMQRENVKSRLLNLKILIYCFLDQFTVPITMCHIVNCLRWSIDGARDSGISSCPAGKVFKVWSGFILVALEAVVKATVRVVERGVPDPGPDARGEA